jgi:ZIP family zinc transporter
MLYVSFVEIFVKAQDALISELGEVQGTWMTVTAFFGGILLIALIDKLVPSFENPHEVYAVEEMDAGPGSGEYSGLLRMGLFTALAIAIHNFPEGLATFTAALTDTSLGISIAVAIAIHNIPEGIAVSVPVYYATGDRKKAFFYSFLSGLAEPVGAGLGYILFIRFFTDVLFGLLFAMVAGIMVFISLDELLPTAEKFGEHHLAIYGLIAGMAVMALSLLLFV